jgi:hypothetical protein
MILHPVDGSSWAKASARCFVPKAIASSAARGCEIGVVVVVGAVPVVDLVVNVNCVVVIVGDVDDGLSAVAS